MGIDDRAPLEDGVVIVRNPYDNWRRAMESLP
jgi:hypothetical protein